MNVFQSKLILDFSTQITNFSEQFTGQRGFSIALNNKKQNNIMRLVFLNDKQKELITKYKELKNCTWRELSKVFNVDWKTIRDWRDEEYSISDLVFDKIIDEFPQLSKFKNFITVKLDDNWGAIKGAYESHKTVRKKLKIDKNFREKWIKKCRIGGINNIKKGYIKNWEVGFRKISKRQVKGPMDEMMFNKGEKNIAELLLRMGQNYQYEPLINLNGNHYFPDFLVNDIIIERCGLLSKKYFQSVKKKFKDYESWKGKVIIVISKKTMKIFKKEIEIPKRFIHVVEDENLTELEEAMGKLIVGTKLFAT